MITEQDRYHIERKYHDPEKEFNPFRRKAYHGAGYLEESGKDDEEILAGLDALAPSLKDLPHPVARAKALGYVMEQERLYINEHDYFVGLYSLNRLANKITFKAWEAQSKAFRDPETLRRNEDFNGSGASMIWTDYDHVVPDFDSLLSLGFPGLRERARAYRRLHEEQGTLTEETAAFFDGIELEYTAILDLVERMAKTARKMRFEKAPVIAECLEALHRGAPETLYQALQLIYLYFIISECIDGFQVRSLGNGLDQTLLPFYKSDLEKGLYTEEELRDFLAYFFLQWSSIGNYWGQPFYMGGTALDGSTKYNELSLVILDVYDKLEIYNPKIQLKINTNTPDALLEKAFDMVRRKNAAFVFCCEPAMVKAIMGYGATYEEAMNYDIRGCYETGVRANEVSSISGYVNAAKAVEYVFTNGFDTGLGKQVGLQTGSLDGIQNFEDFYFAFIRQWEYLIEETMKVTDDAERFLAFVNPSSMYSATVETSLKNGKDGYGGGVKFNNCALLNCAFASAVDSLMAVKEFVFEKKELSLASLAEALQKDWKDYEILQAKVKKSACKYGNHHPQTDAYASAMAGFFAGKVNNRPNSRGGVYKATMHSARAFVTQGEKTLATPDGRRAGQELSKNGSAVPGADRCGVTALVASALALCPADYHESFCVDVMLHPSALEGEEGFSVFKGILMTYLQGGGQSIQFNLFRTETLRDAQENPEKYKNLQVRVCGWNTLWNNMSRKEQDAYILRAENIR